VDPQLLAFAEDPAAFVRIGPDEDRVVTERAVIMLTPGEHFWSTSVARVRFRHGDVASGLDEVRSLIRARGRRTAAWSIGPSATPAEVAPELTALGLERESESGSSILVLTQEPAERPSPFEVRPVSTYEDHLAAIGVKNEGFGMAAEDAEDELRRARDTFDAERGGDHSARLLVLDGDRPIASGQAWFAAEGVYLGGGATIPSHRRRGAMSHLIAAAWSEAVRRGTPALVTSGGEMSTPPLVQLGFQMVGRIDRLIDRFPS
jgi:hypothetical protein